MTAERIIEVIEGIKELLLEKNKRYGNSALEPINVFSKADSTESILVRLDDKLKRIQNSEELRTNDLADITGYLILLQISRGITKEDILNLID
jgi:hypothetical protein